MDVVRIKSDGKGIRFPSPLRTIVQRCKHYPHEPYRKVKSGLNTATAIDQLTYKGIACRSSTACQWFPAIIFRNRDLRRRSYL